MFELFATGRKGGTGLGLAIVKKIIDDHRGTIHPETGPLGTTFVIRMPLARPADGDHADGAGARSPPG
jgi:signal transduction histidine kinase